MSKKKRSGSREGGLLFAVEDFRRSARKAGEGRADEKIDESSGTRCDKFSLALPTARKSPRKLFEGNDRLTDEAHERVKLQRGGIEEG